MSDAAPPSTRHFLNVTRSAAGRAWAHRLDPEAELMASAIAQSHGLPDIVARVLAGRGVTIEAVPGFLTPKLRDLMPDPYVLRDMDAAVDRLVRAVRSREKRRHFRRLRCRWRLLRRPARLLPGGSWCALSYPHSGPDLRGLRAQQRRDQRTGR